MLVPIADLEGDALGFEAKGKVRGSDYEQVMIPAVESALEDGEQVSLLYLLGEGFEGFTADAAWQDTKLGLHHASSFDRIALVTDSSVYRDTVKLFGRLMKAEVRVFELAELESAKQWIAA